MPAKALLLNICRFRISTEYACVTIAVTFAYGMSARCEGNGFLIVHRHTRKGNAHIMRGFEWIRLTIHTFRVHVDQPHLNSGVAPTIRWFYRRSGFYPATLFLSPSKYLFQDAKYLHGQTQNQTFFKPIDS